MTVTPSSSSSTGSSSSFSALAAVAHEVTMAAGSLSEHEQRLRGSLTRQRRRRCQNHDSTSTARTTFTGTALSVMTTVIIMMMMMMMITAAATTTMTTTVSLTAFTTTKRRSTSGGHHGRLHHYRHSCYHSPASTLTSMTTAGTSQYDEHRFRSSRRRRQQQQDRYRRHYSSTSVFPLCVSKNGGGSGKVWEGEENRDPNLLKLAELSLKDYEWRREFFERQEADRKVEESVARLMGDEPSYVRPMDAGETKIGPLGLWEKSSVDWLRQVIEEEGQRAKEIVRLGGILVRPIDAAKMSTTASDGTDISPGPLAELEQRVVDFLEQIRAEERERSRRKIARPKDVEDGRRGPLGEAERRASETIREILQSEITRAKQSRLRDGIVRPIDVPGPLGEFELKVLEIVRAEEARALESKRDPQKQGKFGTIRPMNAKQKGPLGEMEEKAIVAVNRLTAEEKERLRNIQRYLAESRPMEQDKNSFLGIVETIFVGIVRAPILIYQIASRVKELLESEPLGDEDAEILERAARKK